MDDTVPTEFYTLSLHDALPIYHRRAAKRRWQAIEFTRGRPKRVPLYRELVKIARTTLAYLREAAARLSGSTKLAVALDRKSTRLNSSHTVISYAVFCLKKISIT